MDAHGVGRNVIAKDQVEILGQALAETGAWLTFLTCVLLLAATVITWYVLRARARALKVLNGAPIPRIVLADLASLVMSFAPPALLGVAVSVAVIVIQGKASHLPEFLLTLGALLTTAVAGMMMSALGVGSMTWPSVDGIASREPPERQFRSGGEALKAATLVLVAVILPVLGASIAQAGNLSNQQAKWQVLKDNVALRLSGAGSEEEFARYERPLRDMVASASGAGKLTFSYAFAPRDNDRPERVDRKDLGEFDGVVLVNPDYLRRISPLIGSDASDAQLLGTVGERLGYETLPQSVQESWSEQFRVMNRAGRSLEGLTEGLRYYRYTGQEDFPAQIPVPGEIAQFRNPLIIVADQPAEAFTDGNIDAFLSSGNITFTDSAWVRDYLQSSPLSVAVLSVDRIADAALYNSQLQNQSAGLKTLSFVLVLLALTMSIAVSAMVYAISRNKRLFVQRTVGWPRLKSLARRLAWEAALAATVAVGMFFALGGAKRPEVLWTLTGIPLYLAISAALHVVFAKSVFSKTLARRA
ncbi:hypothetical protein [Sinomonas terrae]|uniref:Permease n=1 Tax=Sinomonas terrae TaxID=2908838 RepID=A0ABS9U185_9MICC|nr:hypothetical protein [Sinomonas terrae]MCH6470444.1 hypothetical protein [Sinomonas terrae]